MSIVRRPLGEGKTIKCRYCNALVCSGEHDWVLAEITQPQAWQPYEANGLLAPLRARDPGLASAILEDRASYVFWKWIQAGREGTVVPLRKCAAPALVASGMHTAWARGARDIAVGGADTVACRVAGADGFDRVDVRVAWSARFDVSPAYGSFGTVLRLARRTGVVSEPSMTALVCRACGAPLHETDNARCDHCGAELSTGEQTWVLEAVGPDPASSGAFA